MNQGHIKSTLGGRFPTLLGPIPSGTVNYLPIAWRHMIYSPRVTIYSPRVINEPGTHKKHIRWKVPNTPWSNSMRTQELLTISL